MLVIHGKLTIQFMEAITIAESKRLVVLENRIQAGQKTFVEVGLALAEIRDSKLYKADHKTFEDYCYSRWGWQRRYAYNLMEAAGVVDALPENVHNSAQNVSHGLALSKVEPEKRAEVLTKAVESANGEGKPLTARHIKEATPPPRKHAAPIIVDGTGLPVPKDVLALWNRGHEAQEVLTYISVVKSKLNRARDDKDLLFRAVSFNSAIAALEQAYAECKQAKPFAVCPTCQGKLAKQCGACGGAGLVSEFYWRTCVPQETKDAREKIVKGKDHA